jgi:glutathione S-transferase
MTEAFDAIVVGARRAGSAVEIDAMKLFYSPGTSSQVPHIVLCESGLVFEAIRVDEHTKAMDKGGDYRTINPLGYVPALQLDDGTILTEAVAIVQYIADRVPAKRLAPPNGTVERAKLQSWLNFFSAEVHVGCFCPLFDAALPPAAKTIFRERLNSRLAHVEHRLTEAEYLLGKEYSIADAYLFVVSNWARPANVDFSLYPNILSLRKRVGTRPAVQAAMRTEGLIS